MTELIAKHGEVEILDSEIGRVTIDYDTDISAHVVHWQCCPDENMWQFTSSGRVRVGELRYAIAVAAMVVDFLTQGRAPIIFEDDLERFDMKWYAFTCELLNNRANPF